TVALDDSVDDSVVDDSVSEELAQSLADWSHQADQTASDLSDRSAGDRDWLFDLHPDLEEPLLSESSLPETPILSEAASLESAVIPDLPEQLPEQTPEDEPVADRLEADLPAAEAPEQAPTALAMPAAPDSIEAGAPEAADGLPGSPAEASTSEELSVPDWFLGIDVGTTGLSAVLLDRQLGQVYPLYWQTPDEVEASDKRFRLPAAAWMTASGDITAVGLPAWEQTEPPQMSASGQLLKQLKPLMKVAIPHAVDGEAGFEPILQWSDTASFPLQQVQTALEALVGSLTNTAEQLHCGAIGLEDAALRQALAQLQGVILGYPTNWPDTYSLNLREVILSAGLVPQADQIFFIEDAIAAALSGLPDPQAPPEPIAATLARQPSLYNCDWQGGTLVISGGATTTELALVDLPKQLSELTYAHFALRSFPYAGSSIDQDILCQLLHPPSSRQTISPDAAAADQTWQWQANLPADASTDWQSLALETLALPQAGETDLAKRHRLQQRLESSPLGQSVLEAVRHLKLILQHQNQFQLDLGAQRWVIKRRDLESRIFLAYIQRINRHLNVLLSQQGLSTQAIKQVVCTGGSASLPAIARWLRQKFPNATIIQDTYAGDRPNSCSRIAYGLVNLARYPQVLDITRQQYSDYFLLMELLRILPDQPMPVSGIMHALEQRGINTQACQLHVLALLEGHLPPGLVPTEADRPWISNQSRDIATYQALTEAPLFTKQSSQIYVPNETQGRRLRAYLEQVIAEKAQTLDEPLFAQLAVETLA
ncbi:MAG: hypothetical protein F6J97_18340, partial [Leptolyngbya sp. SIO4C1]|nr:hypothetical protein [Leptolyngbya sp. SIO4C1]